MPRLKSNVPKQRLNCNLPLSVWDKATELLDRLQFDSISEVVRRSFEFYEDYYSRLDGGEKLVASNGEDIAINQPQMPTREQEKRYNALIAVPIHDRIRKQVEKEDGSMVEVLCKSILLTHQVNSHLENGKKLTYISNDKSRQDVVIALFLENLSIPTSVSSAPKK